ncbi:ROK family transcriptional regulator [Eubacterium sp. am_0171]|uniref:N-acetyl-D-glucosamine kinase n=1 Tax=Faecalicatena contorta TaxID=39482 RepID=A0A174M799_9FIRM|nr:MULTISPECIES: ROK family transcriptional regulator [Clostridia]MSC85739.1 ROK family protein [Eubacterium sp. BIOML-A1]MSD07536.1 ROK family protein [Eubacterium sp. BIOML-A2]RYT14668.1 ROK family transcriptional regulator [Eubacterium sp. am_0171]CUP29875.1 N-acetyl-D-glucosamine kinase [[Eubacterium] contortum] [Faecalicatena contorta]
MGTGIGIDKRKANLAKVAKFILHRRSTSKPEIAAMLGLSMPTVLQNVKELLERGIIVESGEYESTGGRKAKALSVNAGLKYAAGIDITANHISYVVIDLTGELIEKERIRAVFENSLEYNEKVHQGFLEFVQRAGIEAKRILGVGISLPGIIDKEHETLIISHILRLKNVSLKNLSRLFEYEVCYENDANSAAMAEMYRLEKNAVYLSLSNSVGGSFYIHNGIYEGDDYRSSEFGHMIIVPGGRQCYCGKKGCVDAYCSAQVLAAKADDNLEQFFERLDRGDEDLQQVWDEYLEYLAVTVTNLRMAYDCDIILGGYVGGYLEKYMAELSKRVIKYNGFENDTTYLKTCSFQKEVSAVGIAMSFVENFFESLGRV